jgi:hypothetical protein
MDMIDENLERIRMPTKNKRPKPWLLEIRYTEGFAKAWGWRKWGAYRTEDEALRAKAHYERTGHARLESRISRLDNMTKA